VRETAIGQQRDHVGNGAVDRERDQEEYRCQNPETRQTNRFA